MADIETISAVVAARGEDTDTLRRQLASAIMEIAALQQQVADLQARLAALPAPPVTIN